MSFGVFQFRRGTASGWTSANPVLADGELGLESDTGKFKIGNGTSTWTALPYGGIQGAPGSPGATPTIGINNVSTLAPGSSATVSNVGTSTAASFNFGIPQGAAGAAGNNGWSPILALITDGARRVLQVTDWTGGQGTKPSVGSYIGATGFTATLANAVDIRGATGANGITPTNALTTDTPQTLTTAGVKTFPPNTLLMQNAAGTATAEPYSDINAPGTLERTLQAAPAGGTLPPVGESFEWTPDGKTLWMRASDGTDTLIGPSAGGSSDPLLLPTDWGATQPATPTTGLVVFSRHRARRTLAVIGPQGIDTALQPALFSNRIGMVSASPGSAVENTVGFTVARTTVPTAAPIAATNFFTRTARLRYATSNSAGAGNGVRSGTTAGGTTGAAGYMLSALANAGGFFFVARFGVAVSQAGSRGFIGLATTLTQFPLAAEPSADTAQKVGFYWDSNSTNLALVARGASAQTLTPITPANFPVKTSAVDFYEARLFAPSGSSANVHWSITRLNTNDIAQGILTANLPAADVSMAVHVGFSNGTTGAVGSIDIQSVYIETDN